MAIYSVNESIDSNNFNENSTQEDGHRRNGFLTDTSEADISSLQRKLKKQPMHKNTLKFLENHLPGLKMIEEKADVLEASKKMEGAGTHCTLSNQKQNKQDGPPPAKQDIAISGITKEDSFHFSETREIDESLQSSKLI